MSIATRATGIRPGVLLRRLGAVRRGNTWIVNAAAVCRLLEGDPKPVKCSQCGESVLPTTTGTCPQCGASLATDVTKAASGQIRGRRR